MRIPGDQADMPTSFRIKIIYCIPTTGFIIGNDAADAWLLTADDLRDSDAAGLNTAQQPIVAPGPGDDDAVHKAVLKPFQTALFSFGIIVRCRNQGGVAQPFGFILNALKDLREDRQVQAWNDDA